MKTYTFAEAEKVIGKNESAIRSAFQRKRALFVEGRDYTTMTRREYNKKYCDNKVMRGNPNIPVILLTESGCDIISGVKKEEKTDDVIQIIREQTKLIEQDLKRNEEFRQMMMDSFSLLAKLMLRDMNPHNEVEKPQAKTEIVKPKAVTVNEKPFSEWRENIYNLLPKNKNKRNEVLCEVYKKMNSVYGVCWDQQKREFKNEVGRSCISTLEVAHWLDCKKEWKGIFANVICDVYNKPVTVAVTDNRPVFPVATIDDIAPVIQYIADKTGNKSKNGCSILIPFYASFDKENKLDWKQLGDDFIKRNPSYKLGKRVRRLDIARADENLGSALINSFNEYAKTRYGNILA